MSWTDSRVRLLSMDVEETTVQFSAKEGFDGISTLCLLEGRARESDNHFTDQKMNRRRRRKHMH